MNGLCSVRKLGSNVLVLERYFFLVFVHCKLVSLAICLVILGSFFFYSEIYSPTFSKRDNAVASNTIC